MQQLVKIIVCALFLLLLQSAYADTLLLAPHYYAIVVGVAKYQGESLHLRFADKDAESIANALTLGADRFFGADKVQMHLLSTTDKSGWISPTKQHIKQAFEKVATTAKAEDVLVVYFAGHGITLPQGEDLFCFLTSEARTTDDIIDPGLRNLTAITSEELRQWLNRIPARKQVIILDTCSAGAAADNLMEKRDVSGDQQRAIARLRERSGLHLLMGCAADARSYEATQYGQGLLTYALLQGMKGAALRDGRFLDITTLFSYVVDTVPTLAKNIGGIQRPVCALPRGQSYDIGELSEQDRQQMPLTIQKTLLLRPALMNPDVIGDPLLLSSALLGRLRNAAFGADAQQLPFVFIDTDDFPGAISPKGFYTEKDGIVTATVKLWRDDKEVCMVSTHGPQNDPGAIADGLVNAISEALK